MTDWTTKTHQYRGFTINEMTCDDPDEGDIVEIVGEGEFDRWESLADAQRYIDEKVEESFADPVEERRFSPFEFQRWI